MIREGGLSAELSGVEFEPQDYTIALRSGSPLRKGINIALQIFCEVHSREDMVLRKQHPSLVSVFTPCFHAGTSRLISMRENGGPPARLPNARTI
jgi:hypothetical protein